MNKALEIFRDYLLFERNLSPQTIKTYENQLKYFLDYLDENGLKLNKLSSKDIRDYLLYLSEIGLSERSISLSITVLKSFYKFLNKDEITKHNPMTSIESPKLGVHIPSYLTEEEIDKFLKSIDISTPKGLRDRTIFEFLFSTGVRVSELCDLKLNNLNLGEGSVIIRGKGNKERIGFLGEILLAYLDKYLSKDRKELLGNYKSEYIFIGNRGNKLNRSYIFQLATKYAKISSINKTISPHTFRHSYASSLIKNNADLVTVKTLLGHSDISTTTIYTHLDTKTLKSVYNKAHPFGKKEN